MAKIYVQTHILAEEGYLPEPIFPGEEGDIRTNKSFITNKRNWGLVFLITSGLIGDYIDCGFPNCELPEIDGNIYFLWQKFHIEKVVDLEELGFESGEEAIQKFGVSGKRRAMTFNPPILLNELENFGEFKDRYLRTGLTNVAKNYPPDPPFLDTLLKISGERPFYLRFTK
jgi:hypothetical protein